MGGSWGRIVAGLWVLAGAAGGAHAQGCEGLGTLVENRALDYSERVSGILVADGRVTVYGTGSSRNDAAGYQFYRRVCFTKDGQVLFTIPAHPINARDGSWNHYCGAGGPGRPPGRYQVIVQKWAERPGVRYRDSTPEDNGGVASIQVDDGPPATPADGVDYVVLPVDIAPRAGGQFEFHATVLNNGDTPPGTATRAKVRFEATEGLAGDEFDRRFRPRTEFDLRLLSPGDEETFTGTLDLSGMPDMPPRIVGKVRVEVGDGDTQNNERAWGLELAAANGVSPTLSISRPEVVVNKQPAWTPDGFEPGTFIVDGIAIVNAGGPAVSVHWSIEPATPGAFAPVTGQVPVAEGARSWKLEPRSVPLDLAACDRGPASLQVIVKAYAKFDDGFGNGNLVQSPTTTSEPSDPDPVDACPTPPDLDGTPLEP